MTDLIYGGVGSRRSPPNILQSMTSLGYQMSQSGWHLRSGFGDGADKAFGQGAAFHSDETGRDQWTMYLPWSGYNGAIQGDERFQTVIATDDLYKVAVEAHNMRRKVEIDLPEWQYLKNPTKLLFIRNVPIVAGLDLGSPAVCVIGYTYNALKTGGTGHTFAIAKIMGVPVFDLASAYDQRALIEFVNGYEKKIYEFPF